MNARIGRRAVLLGGAATFSLAGCTTAVAPTMAHNGHYHFTMPPGRTLDDLLRDLPAYVGGPVKVENIADRNHNERIDAGDIVTVSAPPSASTGAANAAADRASAALGVVDFEADFKAVGDTGNESHWFCSPEKEQPLAAGSDNCSFTDGTWNDFGWALRRMRVPQAWDLSTRMGRPAFGEGIVVGHIDTGVAQHVELDGAVLWNEGVNLVEPNLPGGIDPMAKEPGHPHLIQPGHGTATASVIVSRGGVGVPPAPRLCGGTTGPGRITGTAPMAMLLPVRAINFTATSNLTRIARAIDLLGKRNVGVMTMAIGWPFGSKVLQRAIRDAVNNDILVLAAAGNFYKHVVYPAAYAEVIAIGATGPGNLPWCGSARGTQVVVCAPGEKVWRAIRSDEEKRLDVIGQRYGTSFAVSQIAGVAALWLAHHDRDQLVARLHREKPGRTLQDAFRGVLKATAYTPPGWPSDQLGAGIVQADRLLDADPLAYA